MDFEVQWVTIRLVLSTTSSFFTRLPLLDYDKSDFGTKVPIMSILLVVSVLIYV